MIVDGKRVCSNFRCTDRRAVGGELQPQRLNPYRMLGPPYNTTVHTALVGEIDRFYWLGPVVLRCFHPSKVIEIELRGSLSGRHTGL